MTEIGVLAEYSDGLNHLFAEVYRNGSAPYTTEQVATELRVVVDAVPLVPTIEDINALRSGVADPDPRYLDVLAEFFGVPSTYFRDADVMADVNEQIHLLSLYRQLGVHGVMICRRGSAGGAQEPVAERRMLIALFEQALRSGSVSGGQAPDAGAARRPLRET